MGGMEEQETVGGERGNAAEPKTRPTAVRAEKARATLEAVAQTTKRTTSNEPGKGLSRDLRAEPAAGGPRPPAKGHGTYGHPMAVFLCGGGSDEVSSPTVAPVAS